MVFKSLVFSHHLQIETILQVLGSAAIIQLLSKKLLFAEVSRHGLSLTCSFCFINLIENKVFCGFL